MMWKFPEAWQQNMKKARGDEGPYLSNNNLLGDILATSHGTFALARDLQDLQC
jgi:hypothetical protein